MGRREEGRRIDGKTKIAIPGMVEETRIELEISQCLGNL
jgi:hypothetical protein